MKNKLAIPVICLALVICSAQVYASTILNTNLISSP